MAELNRNLTLDQDQAQAPDWNPKTFLLLSFQIIIYIFVVFSNFAKLGGLFLFGLQVVWMAVARINGWWYVGSNNGYIIYRWIVVINI